MRYRLGEITEVARQVLAEIEKDKATIVAMEGDLGTGKTALTREIGRLLEVKDEVVSPTFVLHLPYEVKGQRAKGKSKVVNHIDAWRMESFEELMQIGLEKMLENKDVIILEWADKFKDQVQRLKGAKAQVVWVKLNYAKEEDEREVEIEVI
jgi:tRNA threonylcarbamoyl adenosine modification protein YjeE